MHCLFFFFLLFPQSAVHIPKLSLTHTGTCLSSISLWKLFARKKLAKETRNGCTKNPKFMNTLLPPEIYLHLLLVTLTEQCVIFTFHVIYLQVHFQYQPLHSLILMWPFPMPAYHFKYLP